MHESEEMLIKSGNKKFIIAYEHRVFNITVVEILRASKSKKGFFVHFSSNLNKIIHNYKCF
jgi:hypothetical protein